MSFLLDTNTISEVLRPKPSLQLVSWLKALPVGKSFVSALTVGEIRFGIVKLPPGLRRDRLIVWLEREIVAE